MRDPGNAADFMMLGSLDAAFPVVYSGGEGVAFCIKKVDGSLDILDVNPRRAAAQVADLAQSQLALPLPDVGTSPPQSGILLAGIPVWFWVTNALPQTTTATITGLSATLTATPEAIQIDPDDGPTVTCAGTGVPYDPTRPASQQHSACSHIFETKGRHSADITVTWRLTWQATNGQSGELPVVERTTTLDLRVQEARSVTD